MITTDQLINFFHLYCLTGLIKEIKMINLMSEMVNLQSETINIDTKLKIYCFVMCWSLKMTQNDKFIVLFWQSKMTQNNEFII